MAHNCHGKIFFVTAKSFWPRQNHFGHGKIILLSRQNLFRHGKIIFVTAKSFWPRQNLFRHGKIIFVTAKSFWPRQNLFRHGKIILATAKSFWPRQNHFCTHVTSVRKVLWELINYGGQLTHSFISSRRCFAQSVANFCEFLCAVWTR